MTSAWAGRLRLAMRMGVAPEVFWRLSLAEWRALTEADSAPVLGRAGLEALLAAHPDPPLPSVLGEGSRGPA